ncbi:MAG: transposase [Gammaproteobacteria bacterium]|nr:transposase [Gammaproteobacteria bacterium]
MPGRGCQHGSDHGHRLRPSRDSLIVSPHGTRVVVATMPVDFRKGHDGLAAVMQEELGLDPYSGVACVFRSRSGDRIKVLL